MRGFSFLRLVYKLFEFFGLAYNVCARREIWHGWVRKRTTIGIVQLGMVFVTEAYSFLVDWRYEDFVSHFEKFETDLVWCFAHVFLLCMCVSFKSRPLQDKIATRAKLLIDVINGSRIFAQFSSTILQVELSGHLGLWAQGNISFNAGKFQFNAFGSLLDQGASSASSV